MASKKKFGFEHREQPAAAAASKLPIDSAGAGKALSNFQDIPVEMLHPCTLKGTSDYSKYGTLLQEQVVESMKEHGVLEPLIVRKSPIEMSKYEILAGEQRWTNAKAAGLKTVPCRIMDLDDDAARNIFHITNLLRRDLSPRDLIYGWYNYYTQIKGGNSADEAINVEITKAVAQEQAQVAAMVGGKSVTLRMIQRYVRMHDLIDPWLDRLDAGAVTGRIAYHIAFLPPDVQEQLLEYKLSEPKISWLHKVYAGTEKEKWHENIISENFEKVGEEQPEEATPVVLTKEEKAQQKKTRELNRRFKKALPRIADAVKTKLRPDDYERADEVLNRALELYYQQEG